MTDPATRDQAAGYHGPIGDRGPEEALGVTELVVAETREELAHPVEVGDLPCDARTQREFAVSCPHPLVYVQLSLRTPSGETFSYRTNQVPGEPHGRTTR